MAVSVVVGLQWGDEGKGKVVDFLSKEFDIVARFSGGANARHAVVSGSKEVLVSLVPSAILQQHTQLYICDGVVVDPYLLSIEIARLEADYGFDKSRLFIGHRAIVTLPYHRFLDVAADRIAGKDAIGTTGVGMGPTRIDHVARQGVRMSEFLDPAFMSQGIRSRIKSPLTPAQTLVWMPGSILPFPVDNLTPNAEYNSVSESLGGLVVDTGKMLTDDLASGKRILFEGAQGTMLDIVYGNYPYVTSSHTLAGAAAIGSGLGPTAIQEVIGVVKAYSTRVSHGPMLTEMHDNNLRKVIESGLEFQHGSDIPLRCGWLDLVVLRYAVRVNGVSWCTMTKLDALDTFEDINICIQYNCDDRVYYDEFPVASQENNCIAHYHKMQGWQEDTSLIREYSKLPKRAQEYIEFIEKQIGVPIHLISVGRDRDQTFWRSA